MSFWKADSRVAYQQKSISIVAENGKQFRENNKIVINVPADVAFFQPSESYLQFRVKVNQVGGAIPPTRLQLDAVLGGQVLIKNIRILTGANTVIEELQDYNVLANIINSYDTDANIQNKRSLTEGSTIHNPSCRIDVRVPGFNSNTVKQSLYDNANHNPYFTSPPDGKSEQQWVKIQLPLQTGIFRNKKIFPVVMTSGLKIEITLEEAKKCIKCLETTTAQPYVPFVYGVSKSSTTMGKNTKIDSIALSKVKNNITSVENCPFMVGESIAIMDPDGTNSDAVGVIKTITVDGGFVILTFVTPQYVLTESHMTESTICVSTSVSANSANYKPTFTVDEVELVLQKIEVPPSNVAAMMKAMKEQGVMKYEFLAYENYKRSQLKGERQSTMALQLSNSAIKSILTVGTETSLAISGTAFDAGDYVRFNHSQRGLVGVADNISNYQWAYNGILNPDRKVQMAKLNTNRIEQQHLIELEKALVVGGIPPKSFRKFTENVIIGRAMALQQGSYDGRGKDFNLQISNEETNAPALDKLWMSYICHVRTINMSSNGISVQA